MRGFSIKQCPLAQYAGKRKMSSLRLHNIRYTKLKKVRIIDCPLERWLGSRLPTRREL